MKPIVVLDTHAVIWGFKKEASASQRDMIERTRRYFARLDKEGADIWVPMAVLAELAMKEGNQQPLIERVARTFRIAPFDVPAVVQLSRLWDSAKARGLVTALREEEVGREQIKFDMLIIATALARRAHYICSHDGKLMRLAQGLIDVKEVPVVLQPELF